jgi:Lon protease-like protein
VLLPGMALPLHIFEERYKLMISECIETDRPFGLVLFDGQSLHTVGCMARVTAVIERYDDGRMDIMTVGEQRFLIQKAINEKAYMEAYVSFFEDVEASSDDELRPLVENAMNLLVELSGSDQQNKEIDPAARSHPWQLSFAIPALESFTAKERQRFLEMTSTAKRLEKGVQALARIIERARLTDEIAAIIGGNGSPPKQLIDLLSSKDAGQQ